MSLLAQQELCAVAFIVDKKEAKEEKLDKVLPDGMSFGLRL
jgi:hypothetical protein